MDAGTGLATFTGLAFGTRPSAITPFHKRRGAAASGAEGAYFMYLLCTVVRIDHCCKNMIFPPTIYLKVRSCEALLLKTQPL